MPAAFVREVVQFRIGCAGWAIRSDHRALFEPSGGHLERYARRFNAVEINSSFYRPHRRSTYERWAATVPDGFAFAVKVPRTVTHERRLADAGPLLEAFLNEVSGLGEKLGPLLVQLPPKLAFDAAVARSFFIDIRARFDGRIICEPRHATWFAQEGGDLLQEFRIARAAADPAVVPTAAEPGGSTDLCYFRLHGSPRLYFSEYGDDALDRLAGKLKTTAHSTRSCWCIFDNTGAGAATRDALALQTRLEPRHAA